MQNDYISREVTCGDCVHAKICEHMPTLTGFDRSNVAYCQSFINAADVRPVVRGEWRRWLDGKELECSACATTFWNEEQEDGPNFCPNCGAMMGGNNDA